MKIELRNVPPPPIAFTEETFSIPPKEYQKRLAALYQDANADWVGVYADREHYANLTYLINFDPRFEEALLMLGPNNTRKLIVGNENMGYASVLPFPMDMVLAQTFSLGGQPRTTAPRLVDVLSKIGIKTDQTVSLVGWKYLEPFETNTPSSPAFLPAFFVDTFRELVGPGGKVIDGTAVMMHPEDGLRTINSSDQIAYFETAARNCSAAVFSVLRGTRPGMSELEAMRLMNYAGLPQSMHPIFASGNAAINGLRSPSSRKIAYGDGVGTAVGYWGSLVCRCGMMLGEVDQTFVDCMVAPYFKAIVSWYQSLQIGTTGGEVHQRVAEAFEGSGLHSALNPGHLTSYDEWSHSPMRPGSPEKIRSGMVFQADIIPTPTPLGQSMNCEDTIAIADESLRVEIRQAYPAMWTRMQARRDYMQEVLGIHLDESVLPLTDGTAFLPPFWLLPNLVCTVVR